MGADYTINTGDLDNGRFGTTLSVTSTSSATFIANNFEIRGDATNETFTHMDQGIVIHGVNYSVLFDDLIAYTDDNTGDTYTFAAIDVDLNSDGTTGNGEDGVYLVQVSGPAVPNGANLTFHPCWIAILLHLIWLGLRLVAMTRLRVVKATT